MDVELRTVTGHVPSAERLRWQAWPCAVGAAVLFALEVVAAGHPVLSSVLLVGGLVIGLAVGGTLARQLRDAAEDAPVISLAEAEPLLPGRPSRVAIGVAAVVALVLLALPFTVAIATPFPGGLAALAVQAERSRRALRGVERARGGRVLRPRRFGRHPEEELRLLPGGA